MWLTAWEELRFGHRAVNRDQVFEILRVSHEGGMVWLNPLDFPHRFWPVVSRADLRAFFRWHHAPVTLFPAQTGFSHSLAENWPRRIA